MKTRIFKRLALALEHKKRQTRRISRYSLETAFLVFGAALVAGCAWGFAQLADFALHLNAQMTASAPLLAWLFLPLGMVLIVALKQRYAPYTGGSGIPQVIAAIQLPHGAYKTKLTVFRETILKIPLTFLGMLFGASIGREGPSVQVGAAVMVTWGKWCRKRGYSFRGLEENNLLAIGAAGGLAAAFNAPLAGVTFAIEELGRGKPLHWERQILTGIVASGLFLISIQGNNPYFPRLPHHMEVPHTLLWAMLCALVCGISGGLFARALSKGVFAYTPKKIRPWLQKHPLTLAFCCGLVLALLGTIYHGNTYGTGYELVAHSLVGNENINFGSLAFGKWLATVVSYWGQIPGGIFTPCLSTGAIIGQSLASLSHFAVPADFLVLLCMCAFLSAATQSPLTASVIVMEMTETQGMLFWMLLCAIMASIVARQFSPKPFYHFAAGKFVKQMNALKQRDYADMVKDFEKHNDDQRTNPMR